MHLRRSAGRLEGDSVAAGAGGLSHSGAEAEQGGELRELEGVAQGVFGGADSGWAGSGGGVEGEEGGVGGVVEEEGGAGGGGEWCWWALCDSLVRSRRMVELLKSAEILLFSMEYLFSGLIRLTTKVPDMKSSFPAISVPGIFSQLPCLGRYQRSYNTTSIFLSCIPYSRI